MHTLHDCTSRGVSVIIRKKSRHNSVSHPFQDMEYFRCSVNLRGLKVDYENNTNTSFSKFGLSLTFITFSENLVSEFVS